MKNGLERHGLEKWFYETFDENEKKYCLSLAHRS